MNRQAAPFALRQLQRLVLAPRFWGALAAAAIILTLIGPFGTDPLLEFWPRLIYWFIVTGLTFVAGYGTVVWLIKLILPDGQRHPVQIGLIGLAAGLPVAAVTILINLEVFHQAPKAPGQLIWTLVSSALIAAAVAFFYALVRSGSSVRPAPDSTPATLGSDAAAIAMPAVSAARPALLNRLKPELRGQLSHLSMQDHYVEVHTDKGRELILMRLADAIAETAPVAGIRIHRSHWVALDQIRRLRRMAGKVEIETLSGMVLPVSRTYLAAVEALGLPR